ncbi:jg5869 [Pararge aegeria aegeria]|uniref:Jg5869 protein n=1 Tax=Pararge aegeria aegeria TaxID=348720 RepID=A0A8S4RHW1_9NEOP|nr:jg5869 [Pararge aegeria aegeria]
MRFAQAAKLEIDYFKQFQDGNPVDRVTYDLDEASPEELEWHEGLMFEKQEEDARSQARRTERQAARKRHRAEVMIPYLQHLNFVLYWPHMIHAHPELYERWDVNS